MFFIRNQIHAVFYMLFFWCHISQIGLIFNLNFRTDLQMFATELRDKFRNYRGESVLEIFAVCIPMLKSAWITLLESSLYKSFNLTLFVVMTVSDRVF